MKYLLPVLALATILAGCTMAPDYERPASPVAASWPDTKSGEAPQLAADIGWNSVFGDARLQKLIGMALVHTRHLRIAVLNTYQATAQSRITRAAQLPTLNGRPTGQ